MYIAITVYICVWWSACWWCRVCWQLCGCVSRRVTSVIVTAIVELWFRSWFSHSCVHVMETVVTIILQKVNRVDYSTSFFLYKDWCWELGPRCLNKPLLARLRVSKRARRKRSFWRAICVYVCVHTCMYVCTCRRSFTTCIFVCRLQYFIYSHSYAMTHRETTVLSRGFWGGGRTMWRWFRTGSCSLIRVLTFANGNTQSYSRAHGGYIVKVKRFCTNMYTVHAKTWIDTQTHVIIQRVFCLPLIYLEGPYLTIGASNDSGHHLRMK